MKTFSIKTTTLNDLAAIQSISMATFSQTFADSNTNENLQQYLDERMNAGLLQKEMETEGSEFFLAYAGNQVAGYLKINVGAAQTELQSENGVELERIYILQEFFGAGLGQEMLQYAIEIAQQQKAPFLWLGVWEHNHRAIRFYEKNGFVTFHQHYFMVGEDKQTDIMMKLALPALPLPKLS